VFGARQSAEEKGKRNPFYN